MFKNKIVVYYESSKFYFHLILCNQNIVLKKFRKKGKYSSSDRHTSPNL